MKQKRCPECKTEMGSDTEERKGKKPFTIWYCPTCGVEMLSNGYIRQRDHTPPLEIETNLSQAFTDLAQWS
jgi:ribosomal protein L37AE/L43A